jgi:ubiquinone/menaquinone biosynthesis C-methylase UbiE
VIATDASAKQIGSAEAHPGVEYRCARAEDCGLADGSVDLVVAAQAAHWFDRPAFYGEARRVARPGRRSRSRPTRGRPGERTSIR